MKKRLIFVIFALALLMLGCDFGSTTDQVNEEGTIIVNLPSAQDRGSWVNSDVSPLTDTYEIIVYNADNQYSSGSLDSSVGSYSLSLVAGTYDVFVIAGASAIRIIYGTGVSEAVIVESGQSTNVSIGLDTFDWTTTWPTGPITAGSDVSVTVDLNLGNIPLQFSSLTNCETGNILLNDTDIASFYFNHVSDGIWQGIAQITTPSTAGTFPIVINSSPGYNNLYLVDPDYSISMSLNSIASISWCFPCWLEIYSGTALESSLITSITTETASTSILVDISWNPD